LKVQNLNWKFIFSISLTSELATQLIIIVIPFRKGIRPAKILDHKNICNIRNWSFHCFVFLIYYIYEVTCKNVSIYKNNLILFNFYIYFM